MKPFIPRTLLLIGFIAIIAVYWAGLHGAYLFDDYPNIIDNHEVQPKDASIPSLVSAALSSPSSELKRPLSSLSFAVNYLATGLDPFWMKATNLVLHLLNGWLVYLLAGVLISAVRRWHFDGSNLRPMEQDATPGTEVQTRWIAACLALGWMLLPINVTVVLYVVQRMESMANLFVLAGLIGYTRTRSRMLELKDHGLRQVALCAGYILLPTALGLFAKETAIMLPLYAALVEWAVFRFKRPDGVGTDRRLLALYAFGLVLPGIIGLAVLVPGLLRPATWAVRDFTLKTRLLSEARIVVDYVAWTVVPTPHALSFYHDDFQISKGLLAPLSTFVSIVALALGIGFTVWVRKRKPLVALGLALFLGCHLLTGTIIPLELIYEHRNYFASFGLLLALLPWLAAMEDSPVATRSFFLPKRTLFVMLMLHWTALTLMTSQAWSTPLNLAEELAARAPQSPRAQYELGRTYIVLSNYDAASPMVDQAYAPLERAAALPGSSILPEQALIFLNARMNRPIKNEWWDSLIAKLKARTPGVQDESSLGALTQCARQGHCDLSTQRMMESFLAALSHPNPSGRLLSMYADYAWNVLEDRALGIQMATQACAVAPREPAYWTSLARMQLATGDPASARKSIAQIEHLNVANSLTPIINELTRSLTASSHE